MATKRKLTVFNQVTLDGYFTDKNGDMSWAHKSKDDAEWNAFVGGNATGGGVLLFGRITYDLMASYWPTSMAMESDPVVAKQMNSLQKVVFSRTMNEASWSNTKLVKNNMVGEVIKMKTEPGDDMVILGSGTIVSQLARKGLIDAYTIIVCPIVLGSGRTLFDGVRKTEMKLIKTKAFGNGNVLLHYEPWIYVV
jgi:dihydrofolate reductase